MMKNAYKAALLVALLATGAAAQRRDPLTRPEADEIREAAQEPVKRLGLFVKFARARMDAIEQLRADPKAGPDRAGKVHDLLQQFGAIVDELDDNIDDYADKNEDIRKALKDIVEADTGFQEKLKALKDAGGAEAAAYNFVLLDTMDALNANLENAKKTLADQIANKGELKKQ